MPDDIGDGPKMECSTFLPTTAKMGIVPVRFVTVEIALTLFIYLGISISSFLLRHSP